MTGNVRRRRPHRRHRQRTPAAVRPGRSPALRRGALSEDGLRRPAAARGRRRRRCVGRWPQIASASRSRARSARAIPSRPSATSRRSGGGLLGVGQPGVGRRDGPRLDDRREQVLHGVLGDLAGTPVPQRPDLGEVALHVAGGQLPLRRVPEARAASPRARRWAASRRGRPAARSPPSTPPSAAARGRSPPAGPRSRWRPAPPRRRSRRRRPRRWRPARAGTPTGRRRRPPGPRRPGAVEQAAQHRGVLLAARGAGQGARPLQLACRCRLGRLQRGSALSASIVQPVGAQAGSA